MAKKGKTLEARIREAIDKFERERGETVTQVTVIRKRIPGFVKQVHLDVQYWTEER